MSEIKPVSIKTAEERYENLSSPVLPDIAFRDCLKSEAAELRAALEALQAENEELKEDNKYLKQLSFSAIDTCNQYEIQRKILKDAFNLLRRANKHFTKTPSTLSDSKMRGEIHQFLSAQKGTE